MSVTWITHQDKKILYADYRGLRGESILENLELEIKMVLEAPTEVLVLSNVVDAPGSPEFMERARAAHKIIGPKMTKHAIVGVTGLKEVLLSGYNRLTGAGMTPFATEADALKWLVAS